MATMSFFKPASRCVLVLAALVAAQPATAQQVSGVPQAFAAVQAPKVAVEACHASSAQTAVDCARRRCQRKASRGACFAVTVCEPAGWAASMSVQMAEVQFSSTVCGAPTREAAEDALKSYCGATAGARECVLTRVWAPDGKLLITETSWNPIELRK
jgi:hypothetical protein